MALQTSGAISLLDIATEFGGSTPHSISEYYGVAAGIPSSGTISFSNFYGASNAPIYNLLSTSAPSGLSYSPSQSTLNTGFSSTYGYQTVGDAGFGSNNVYELYSTSSYTGDILFEATVLVVYNCSDPGIAISTNINAAKWNWGAHTSRIALQCNCPTPYLYGTSTSTSVGSTISYGSGKYITLHLHHQPSQSRTRAWVTNGADQWGNETTNRVGNIVTTTNHYGSSAIKFGVASDQDSRSTLDSVSTNFTKIKVTPGY